MSKVFTKIKDYIKLQEFGRSDLFLLIGFVFSLPFYIFSWLFMVTKDPNDLIFKPWMMIVCFVVTIFFWGYAFFIEIKRGNIKNHPFLWIFLFFQVFSLVVVLVQPTNLSFDVVVRNVNNANKILYGNTLAEGDVIHLDITIPWETRMFFSFATLVINWFIYINLFYLPKRIKGTDIIVAVGVIVVAFVFVVTLWSYISEAKNYWPFLKAVWSGDIQHIKKYAMSSFLVMSVPYGACMMLGMIFSIYLHALTKKWYWWISVAYCYINMMFSYCRTALIISTITLIFYIVFRLILTFKEHNKRNIIFVSISGPLFITFVTFLAVSLSTKGAFLPFANQIFSPFLKTTTLTTRTYIWKNINLELKNGWWVIGRGFGTHNYILYPMNLVNGDNVCPSHSTFYATLGAGGIFNVAGFYALCAYYVYLMVKCWKVDKNLTIGLSIGFIAYFLYTFTEGVNYIICGVMIPLFYYYNSVIKTKKEAQINS